MKKVIWLIILVIIAILIVMGLTKENKEVFDNFVEEANAVVLADQIPGDETLVSYVKLSEPGYVLVYGTDAGGEEVLLGSSDLLPAGDSFNVIVRHGGKPTSSGSKVKAVAVADDGDGVFDAEADTETLEESAEADVDITSDDPRDFSIEDIADILEDSGYEVNVEAVSDENVMEDDSMESDDSMMMEDDSMEEGAMMDDGDSMESDDSMMMEDDSANQ